ncbi:MAG: esterase family protein [Tannerellaceae bacterium]|jgi:enterochelin esterase-like enzyme|nr:esterase family protein [Tannerellaceae bacterium]
MKNALLTLIFLVIFSGGIFAQESKVSETLKVKSEILRMDRNFSVYLPPGYEANDRAYPVLYLLHGSGDDHTGWIQFGQVQHIADRVIAEGKAAPMIIVMPDANEPVRGYFNVPDGSYAYEDFFFKELIPHVEKTFRVRSDRRYRAVSGLSMGGGGTIYYALRHPDMFAAAAPMSATTSAWLRGEHKASEQQVDAFRKAYNLEAILNSASEQQMEAFKRIRWYITCGDDDFLYKDNSEMHILFRSKNIPHEYRVKDGGHTWSYWRMELAEALEFLSKSFTQF